MWKNWYSSSLIFPVSKVKSLILTSWCGQNSDGTLVPKNLSSYLLSRLFIAFWMLENWLSRYHGKDNKKRKLFYCFAFLSSNFYVVPLSKYLQSDVLTWYCTFLHYFVKISILDICFLFYWLGSIFIRVCIFKNTTPSILKRKMLYPPPSKKNLSQLSFTTLYKVATWPSNLSIGERFDHIHFSGLQWWHFDLDFPNHAMGKKFANMFRLTPWFKWWLDNRTCLHFWRPQKLDKQDRITW